MQYNIDGFFALKELGKLNSCMTNFGNKPRSFPIEQLYQLLIRIIAFRFN